MTDVKEKLREIQSSVLELVIQQLLTAGYAWIDIDKFWTKAKTKVNNGEINGSR